MFDTRKRYLVLQPVGGLGNRLAALLSAHVLAEAEGRDLWVHWVLQGGPPKDRFKAPLESLYQVDGIHIIGETRWQKAWAYQAARRFHLRDSHHKLQPGYDERVLVAPLHGRLQTNEGAWHDAWHALFWKKYHLEPSLAKAVTSFARDHFTPKTIGLQIRVHGHRRTRDWKPVEKFTKFIENRLAQDPQTRFFVSSDDLKVTMRLKDRFQASILSQNKTDKLNTLTALRQTVIDIHLLTHCVEFYSSAHSGLSQFVAFIRNEPRKYPA